MSSLARVIYDPNSFARGEPLLHLALVEEADRPVAVGETVAVVIPAEDEDPESVGTATVASIRNGLLYLDVDHDSFVDQ